jgi:hypothetical protein
MERMDSLEMLLAVSTHKRTKAICEKKIKDFN